MANMMEKAVEFLNENKDKRTLIIFDTDGDGIGAAAILSKTLRKISNMIPDVIPRNRGLSFISEDMLQEIKKKKMGVIITLDIAADEKPENILLVSKSFRIMIVDHHQVRRNLNGKGIVHVNPVFWETNIPSFRYCTSKIIYDICKEITDLDNLDCLAGIGIVNDKCEDYWKDFLKDVCKKYGISLNELRLVNNIISSGYQYSGNSGSMLSFKACLESSSPKDVLNGRSPNSRKLRKFYETIESDIKTITKSWRKDAEILEEKKLIILELDTRFSLNSTISTMISFKKPNYTVAVARKNDGVTSVSLRRQDGKVNCGKIAIKLTKGLKDSLGGGHIPAAGVHIRSKDWKVFRSRLVNSF